jgi:hypothetical protein
MTVTTLRRLGASLPLLAALLLIAGFTAVAAGPPRTADLRTCVSHSSACQAPVRLTDFLSRFDSLGGLCVALGLAIGVLGLAALLRARRLTL